MQELERLRAERDLYRQLAHLSGVDAPDAFLSSALDLVTRAAGAVHGYAALGPVEAPLFVRASGADPEAVRQMLSRGILRHAVETGEVVATDDAAADPDWASRESVKARAIEAVLCAPIGQPALGVITLQSRIGGGPFDERVAPLVADLVAALEPLVRRMLVSVAAERDPTRPWREVLIGSEELIGTSRSLAQVLEAAALYAPLEKTVLVTGPSGMGKSRLCALIHRNSRRRNRDWTVLDAPSLAAGLAGVELFGSVRGAFTGAEDRAGAVERATGSTLFLDEVGELKPPVQAELLRFLESGEFRRRGESRTRHADVRVLAATNCDLEAMVGEGSFREDLYYRLAQLRIEVPGLDHRPEDLLVLAESRLARFCTEEGWPPMRFMPSARRALRDQDWSVGGIRRLLHLVDRAAIHAHRAGTDVAAPHLLPRVEEVERPLRTWDEAMQAFRMQLLTETLEGCGGNVAAAARELDVDRSYLHRLLRSA